nr:hydrogenase maturation nickel metallochaperone HypA [Candidatus Sigynarchaeota archaeon]
MHEFSFASYVTDIIMSSVRKNGVKRVLSVSVEVGEFTMIVPHYLSYCYDIIKESHAELKDSVMVVTRVPGQVKCNACGHVSTVSFEHPEQEQPPEQGMSVPAGTGSSNNSVPPGTMLSPSVFTCSACKGTDTTIIGGRQATVKSMKVDD